MQQTLVIIKPDGLQRGLVGEIIRRFERKGLRLVGIKMRLLDVETAAEHYSAHLGQSYCARLLKYITAGPVVLMVWAGPDSVKIVRRIVGSTDPLDSEPGTIRGDFGAGISMNLIHASDGVTSAATEIANFFREDELCDYTLCSEKWLGQPDSQA